MHELDCALAWLEACDEGLLPVLVDDVTLKAKRSKSAVLNEHRLLETEMVGWRDAVGRYLEDTRRRVQWP